MSKKYPSIGDDRSPIEKVYDTSKSLATTGIALAPLAIGVSVGYKNMLGSNTAASVLSLSTGQGGDVHRKVGESLVTANELKRRARSLARENFKKQLIEGGKIEEILSGKQEREMRALLNTVSAALDDPAITGSSTMSMNREAMKTTIFDILQGKMDEVKQSQIDDVKKIVDDILDTNDKLGSQIFNSKQNLFGEMSYSLVPSISTDGINAAYNPINTKGTMSGIAESRFKKLQQVVGNSPVTIEKITINESKFGTGSGLGHYARISRAGRDPMLVALDLTNVRKETGATIVRTRSGVVTHAAPNIFLDAASTNLLSSNKIDHAMIQASLEGTGSQARFARTYESFAFTNLLNRLNQVGGDFSKLDDNKYYSSLEQFTNQIFTPSSTESQIRITDRARMHSSQAKILGMENITSRERARLVTNLAVNSPGVFDAFANISQTERTASGGLFTSIGLNTLESNQSYAGASPKGVTSLHRLPMVNRVVDPLNARIQQQYNTAGTFVGSQRGLFIMKFGDDAIEKMGFGDGQGYVGNPRAVREDLVKSVMSGHSLGRDDTVFTRELIERKKTAIKTNDALIKVAPGQKIQLRTVAAREAFVKQLIQEPTHYDKAVISALREQGTFVFSGRGDAYKNQVDMFFNAFGGTQSGRGIDLGMVDDRIVTLPKFTGLEGFEIGVSHVSEAQGRRKVHFSGTTDVLSPFQKIFSDFGKITGRPMDASGFERNLGRMDLNVNNLSNIGINFGNQTTIITDSSMIKKGKYNASMQMVSAYLEFDRIKRGHDPLSPNARTRFQTFTGILTDHLNKDNFSNIDLSTTSAKEVQERYTKAVIRSITESMKNSNTAFGADEIGLIFGGIGGNQKYYGFEKDGEGINFLKKTFKDFGMELTDKDVSEIKKGNALAIQEMMAPGPRSSMNRRNTGSMSPRTYNYLGHKLSAAGFSNDKVANFLFSILSRSSEVSEHINSVNQYRTMLESMSGSVGPMRSLEMSKLERVSVQDFIAKAGASPEEAEKFLMKKIEGGKAVDRVEKGFILDFDAPGASDEEVQQMRRIKAAIKANTKAGDGMYIAAGTEFMEDIARTGTNIEKSDGRQRIMPEYIRKVHQFANDLSVIMSTQSTATEDVIKAAKNIGGFRDNIAELFAKSMKGILKGELSGTAYVQTSFIQFNPDGSVVMPSRTDALGKIVKESTDLNAQQASMFDRIIKGTNEKRLSSLAIMDTEAFFSSFSTFEDAAKSEYREREMAKLVGLDLTDEALTQKMDDIGRGATLHARDEAGSKMRKFFIGTHQAELGLGTGSGGFTGIETIVKRDPDLGAGHIQIGSVYRNVAEEMMEIDVHGKVTKDVYFDRYIQTKTGKAALAKLKYELGEEAIGSFQDIAKLKMLEPNRMIRFNEEVFDKEKGKFISQERTITKQSQMNALNDFFSGMVYEKHMISTGEGGGRIMFPNLHVDVHYSSGNTRRMDASLAQGMIADADGDINQVLHPTKAAMTALRESDPHAFNRLLADDLVLRHHTGMFMQMASEGMKNLEKTLASDLTGEEFIRQTILKEHQGKNIGPLDVSIGAMRQGIVSTASSREEAILANQVISMFVGFQETGSIKSKKLPRAMALAEHMNVTLRDLIKSGGESIDDFEKLLKNTVLMGSDLNVNITGIDTSALPDQRMRKVFEEALGDQKFNFQNILNVIRTAASYAGSNNLLEHETTQRMAKAAAGMTSAQQVAAFNRGMSAAPGAVISEAGRIFPSEVDKQVRQAQNVLSETKRLISRGERSMMGPLALGAVGAMAASALMGYKGYDPEPMLMPGEVTDPAVGNAIRNGSIYDSMSSGPSPEMLIERNNNDMINRPIMDSVSRVELNNSFSVRGEAVSYGHAQNMSQQISSMGGRSSVVVNDTRMPITRNYINRLMNE